MNNTIIKNAVASAILTTLYVICVASFFFYASRIFGGDGSKDTILAPIVMLLLLVLSAAITGSLVFGRPVLWYLEGKKQEAISLFLYTLAFLFIVVAFALFLLYIGKLG